MYDVNILRGSVVWCDVIRCDVISGGRHLIQSHLYLESLAVLRIIEAMPSMYVTAPHTLLCTQDITSYPILLHPIIFRDTCKC